MRRHSTDAVSLGFGILFLAIAAWWAIDRYIAIDLDVPHLGWIAAAALILLGLLGVIASLQGDRAAREEMPSNNVAAPVSGFAAPASGASETATSEIGTNGISGSQTSPSGTSASEAGTELDDTAQRAEASSDPDTTPVDDEPSAGGELSGGDSR